MSSKSWPMSQARCASSKLFTMFIGEEITTGVKYSHLVGAGLCSSVLKQPTDYLFTVSLTLQNVADGSRWRVEDTADNSLVDEGLQSGTGDIVVSGIGYPGSNRTLRVKVRKASAAPKYLPFETQVVVGASGGSAYILQSADTIA